MKDRVFKCPECEGSGKEPVPPEGRRIGQSNARTMKARPCFACGGDGDISIEIWETEDRVDHMNDSVRRLAYGGRYYHGPVTAMRNLPPPEFPDRHAAIRIKK